jgi:hypothetical protein
MTPAEERTVARRVAEAMSDGPRSIELTIPTRHFATAVIFAIEQGVSVSQALLDLIRIGAEGVERGWWRQENEET